MICIGCPTWNNINCLKDFIYSLSNIEKEYMLVIWNNNSQDGTKDYIENCNFCKKVIIYNSNENVGMVIPWNFILQKSKENNCTHTFICNDDIRFNKSINNIFEILDNNSEYGLICPSILPKDCKEDDFSLDLLISKYNNKHDVDGLEGPCMIIPQTVYEKVGDFDEKLKNSFNDCDYYERVKKAGYKTIVSRNSWIWHKGGASTSRNPDCQNPVYYKIFQEKHG